MEIYRFDANSDPEVGMVQFDNQDVPTGTVYSDRMFHWDAGKFNDCCEKVWGNTGQLFYNREPDEIEKFLKLYTGEETLVLCKITQYENFSSGYPYWRFDYKK